MNKILQTLVPEKYARNNCVFPRDINDKKIFVDMYRYDIKVIKDLKMMTDREVEVNILPAEAINESINNYYYNETSYVEKNIGESVFEEILDRAIDLGSSDIHIEPFSKYFRVRFRVDGDLRDMFKYPIIDFYELDTIIKLKAKCDITEKRIPQDGRFSYKFLNSEIDIRFSSIPTEFGEKIELRLLDKSRFLKGRKELGFSKRAIEMMDSCINANYGMLVVTGPTGSGKSSTIYSIINEIKSRQINITTIEDPIEYVIEGINQIQVNPKIGLKFDTGLRAILRQDPDFIVVGEIRDKETADMALRAAITGHFVLTTLHTNDVFSTIHRLMDMGVEKYMITSSLSCVISQRLVKKNNGVGSKRSLSYEVLKIDDELKNAIKNNASEKELRYIANKNNLIEGNSIE